MPQGYAGRRRLPLVLGMLLALSAVVAPVARAEVPQPRAELPGSPVGEQLRWVVGLLNGGAANLGPKRISEHFTSDYLDVLPSRDLIKTFRGLDASLGAVTLARLEGVGRAYAASAIVTTDAVDDWRITIAVEADGSHRIAALYLTPVPYPAALADPPERWSELDDDLEDLAPKASFLAAEIDGGQCRTVHGLHADDELAIGSAFKLYVLGELAAQVAQGKAAWDEELAIQDGLRSLPSGDLRLAPAGATYTLLDYAQQMISASDNTATDHLIDRLGRENIEARMGEMGHSAPERNLPLLATREWFALKLLIGTKQLQQYLTGDTDARRAFLSDEVDPLALTLTEDDTATWIDPRRIDTIEWFASAADLCRALASLQRQAQQPGLGQVKALLSTAPGIVFDARVWRYVGYKSGYETGVLNHTWLLQRGDGRWFAMILTLNDPKEEVDGITATRLMVPAAAMLAET